MNSINHVSLLKLRKFDDFIKEKDKFHKIHVFQFVKDDRYNDILDFLLKNEIVNIDITYNNKNMLFYALESNALDNVQTLVKYDIDTDISALDEEYFTRNNEGKYTFNEFKNIKKPLKETKKEEEKEIIIDEKPSINPVSSRKGVKNNAKTTRKTK